MNISGSRRQPVPTPRQTRTPSVESKAQSDRSFALPPLPPECIAEFDPFGVTASQSNTVADCQDVFVEVSTSNNSTEFKDVACLTEAEQTESLRSEATRTSNEVNHHVGTFAFDPRSNGLPQSLVSSAESIDHERCDRLTELHSKPRPEHACNSSSPDTSGDDQHVSRNGRESYVQVWNCFSSYPSQNKANTGLLSDTAAFLPPQREVIKSDDSCVSPALSPPLSPSSDGDVFSIPRVPKRRSITQLSNSDQSVKSCLPSRLAPAPPCEVTMPVNSSTNVTDNDISVESSEIPAASSHVSVLTASPEDDSRLVSPGMKLPRLDYVEEEQTCNVSFSPAARPREPPRQPAVTGPSPVRDRPPPLVIASATQQSPTSAPSSAASSPLDKVIAVGGVNMLAMRGNTATVNSAKTSTSSEVLSPVSPSTRTPPVPPPKLRRTPEVKNEEHLFAMAVDDNSTDDDADIGDIGFSKF